MEPRVLEHFLALAREGSVSAAAEALHISQPTLSRQLIDLERELGCTLFERKTTVQDNRPRQPSKTTVRRLCLKDA